MFERVLEKVSAALLLVGGAAATIMMLHIGADIIGKSFFDKPVPATLEIVAWYYMIATIYLPIAYVQFHRKHLTVELFTQNLEPRKMAWVEGVTSILAFLYIGTLFVLSFNTAVHETMLGEAQDATYFDLPVWPSRWLLPIPLFVMLLVIVHQGWSDFRHALTGQTGRVDSGHAAAV
ncbi:MAG: TRAP transporter small permease [Xanthobacteraceae bacterium]